MSACTGMCSSAGWLSFRRIVDIPFETCVAALESWWRREEHDGDLHVDQSRLRGLMQPDRDSGTWWIDVRLARGPLRPTLAMRLGLDRWGSSSSSTALELIPCQRVRPAASYFRAGHLLLDTLTHSLHVEREIPTLALAATDPHGRLDQRPIGRPH